MGRGILTGTALGALVSAGALAGLSLSMSEVGPGPVPVAQTEVAATAPVAVEETRSAVPGTQNDPVLIPIEPALTEEAPQAAPGADPVPAPRAEAAPEPAALVAPVAEAGTVTLTVPVEPVEVPAGLSPPEAPAGADAAPAAQDGPPESAGTALAALPEGASEPPEARRIPVRPVAPEAPAEAPEAVEAPEGTDAAPEDVAEAEAPTTAPAEPLPEGPAIEVAAIPHAPSARPALGIVLTDGGELPPEELVSNLPYPLTVVVDASAPDAAERMAFWRGVGAEVALSGTLPAGAAPQDAATAVEAWRRAVPWSVAVVEGVPGALQSDRDVLGQVVTELAESGHGLLVHSRGLNSARTEALKAGVPAGVIFREIDGAGETPVIMRRFLDQAAFRASRNEGVILMGRAVPETIETIRDWSLEGRGRTVAISPLSAMLPREG